MDDTVIMGGEKHSGTMGFCKLSDGLHDLVTRFRIQVSCRLIGQKHLGLVQQRSRNGQALLFPAGEFCREPMAQGRQSGIGEDTGNSHLPILGRGPACSTEHEIQITVHRSLSEQEEFLKDDSQLPSEKRNLATGELQQIDPGDGGGPSPKRPFPIQRLDETGLSTPRPTDQIDEFTLNDMQIDISQDLVICSPNGAFLDPYDGGNQMASFSQR